MLICYKDMVICSQYILTGPQAKDMVTNSLDVLTCSQDMITSSKYVLTGPPIHD
jgi:hypothetical protein